MTELNPGRLKTKFALITGGSQGIGRAVAERFAAEGASVAINHSPRASSLANAQATLALANAASAKAGHAAARHILAVGDVADRAHVETMFAQVLNAWPRIDILINNAGIQAPAPSDHLDHASLERILAVNTFGAVYCSELAIRHAVAAGHPLAIVNNSSVHEIIPKPTYLAYSLSKGAMANLTRTLALEFADKHVRVNAVGPGAILTPINDAWRHDEKAKAGVEAHIPMGRSGTPEEIAGVFLFLASDEASYITGQTLYACGGLTLFPEFKTNWSS